MGKMKQLYQELKENNNWDEADKHYNEVEESKCCYAPIILTDICSNCKEHCDKQYTGEVNA